MDCPYPGCNKKHLTRLAEDLKTVHHIKEKCEKKRLLQSAKEVNCNNYMMQNNTNN